MSPEYWVFSLYSNELVFFYFLLSRPYSILSISLPILLLPTLSLSLPVSLQLARIWKSSGCECILPNSRKFDRIPLEYNQSNADPSRQANVSCTLLHSFFSPSRISLVALLTKLFAFKPYVFLPFPFNLISHKTTHSSFVLISPDFWSTLFHGTTNPAPFFIQCFFLLSFLSTLIQLHYNMCQT